ncbi:Hypothetical predicted protein [Paramuricea clavata]|uniref:Uncharacterized protein n=1 Tax=Paramuricea clavata TaxID=317549 RepID=A0A7D9M968_PARCT|nr:Hypothetical predicted protein [Paramuricea clavata]
MKARNRTCSTEDQCRHLGENVQHEECKRIVDDDDDGFYHPWTEWSACFTIGNKEMKARNRTCSTEDQCRHLGENVQHEKCKRIADDDDDETEEKLKLKRLQMRRQGYRAFVIRLVKEIDEICEAESHDYERIQVIDQHLQDKLKLLNELNESILLLCDVEEITHEIEESEEINDRILSKRKKIETILKKWRQSS